MLSVRRWGRGPGIAQRYGTLCIIFTIHTDTQRKLRLYCKAIAMGKSSTEIHTGAAAGRIKPSQIVESREGPPCRPEGLLGVA
jgi:hypothetical protein